MTEVEAKEKIKSVLDEHLNTYEIVPFKRDPEQIAIYTLMFAVVAKTDEVTQEAIESIIRLGARTDVDVTFEGTEVDREDGFDTTVLFVNVRINARV